MSFRFYAGHSFARAGEGFLLGTAPDGKGSRPWFFAVWDVVSPHICRGCAPIGSVCSHDTRSVRVYNHTNSIGTQKKPWPGASSPCTTQHARIRPLARRDRHRRHHRGRERNRGRRNQRRAYARRGRGKGRGHRRPAPISITQEKEKVLRNHCQWQRMKQFQRLRSS